MVALCSMLSGNYYAQNYASIIGGSLYTAFTATVLVVYNTEYFPITVIAHSIANMIIIQYA